MSVFVYCTDASGLDRADRVRSRMADLGLTMTPVLEDQDGCLLLHRSPNELGDPLVPVDRESFILRTGMFFYRNLQGADALKAFFRDFDPEQPTLEQTLGQFCLAIKKNRRIVLLTDRLGTNKIYCTSDGSLFSNQFIGIAEGIEAPQVDSQGCYEYAWNGATFGEKTFLENVRTVPVGNAVRLGRSSELRPLPPLDLEGEPDGGSTEHLLHRHVENARNLFALYAGWFGDRLNLSMSGGYDSRLLLALLVESGVHPSMFVYGEEGESETRIALDVAASEKLSCLLVDKSKGPRIPPEDYSNHLIRNYALFDGWKNDGLFDAGQDGPDRAARVEGGKVKVNGSVGEIYRNFFYLPGGAHRVKDVVWSFYSRYDPRACTRRFDPVAYESVVAGEIKKAIGTTDDLLTRHQVEQVYPLFRGRYWTARDVPVNQSFGPFLVPFIEPSLIVGTCAIPIALKNYGVFEGRMIRKLNRRIASYNSIYGFSFAADPPLKYRLKMQLSHLRPPLMRRYSYRLQYRRPSPRPHYLEERYLRAVLDTEFPFMRKFFNLDNIHDPDVLNRVATMEFICQRVHAHTA